jgi:1-acyl-sn-glycerol-3-phosphate acyltransferase
MQLTDLIGAMLAELRGASAPSVSLDHDLERDLGIDSLARAELALRIEQAYGVRLDEERVLEARTVADLAAALAAAAPRLGPGLARPAPLAAGAVEEPRGAATLLEALDWHAARHPGRVHLTLLEGDEEGARLTYAELAARTRAVAHALRQRRLLPGESVAIMLPTCAAYFPVFLGVLAAGGVPAPIYPPFRWTQIEEHLRRQARILENCAAPVLVSVAHAEAAARVLQAQVPTLRHVVAADDLLSGSPAEATHAGQAAETALLQYTSGSTGQPKGVVLTHANLLANIRAMGSAIGARASDVFVSWLPLYHDMGLIGAWLGSLYYGIPLVLLPTPAFIARPARWLWALHRYRGTLSAGPNSAYEIVASKVPDDELAGLDLSGWRVAFNGAEPVRAATLERFAQRLAPHGFDARAAAPVYGLAECALGLTFPPIGRAPLVDSRGLVSCGRPLPGQEVRVVDTLGREAPDGAEGRIEFRGASATAGYFRNPEATRALMRDGWLDTGDLGYVAAGELYVTGRVKDVIIRGGQHIHPYDLEEAVGALPGVRKGCVAVFGATDAATRAERVVVVAETRLDERAARERLRRRIAGLALEHLGVPADDVVLAGARVVLKTSSGKIRRSACRELYERGLLGAAQRPVALQLARLALSALAGGARRLARHAGELAYGVYAWLVFGLLAAPGAAALCFLPAARRGHWARLVARLFLRLSFLPVNVGQENPAAGPAVYVANHASYLDAVLLTALLPPGAHFAAKREFASAPLLGWLLARIGTRFVERFAAREAIEGARELAVAARAGESLVLFPEGTFTREPGMRAFHMGAFVAAAQSGRPLVPVALRGTRSVLRDGAWLPRRAPVQVHIGAPLAPRGADWSDALALRDAARQAILAHCGEPERPG